jgi:polyribonucleotide nucleotidyltransferase
MQIDLFSTLHGVSLFQRGLTQVISVVALAALKKKFTDEIGQFTMSDTFLHHYNFLNFSTGSLKGSYSPSRREVGHAFLAKKALVNLLPKTDVFPYTIRVVSDVLSSNGSTSQASICAASLSLMAAGVPLKRTVSGIALGLVTKNEQEEHSVILTDIDG